MPVLGPSARRTCARAGGSAAPSPPACGRGPGCMRRHFSGRRQLGALPLRRSPIAILHAPGGALTHDALLAQLLRALLREEQAGDGVAELVGPLAKGFLALVNAGLFFHN